MKTESNFLEMEATGFRVHRLLLQSGRENHYDIALDQLLYRVEARGINMEDGPPEKHYAYRTRQSFILKN